MYGMYWVVAGFALAWASGGLLAAGYAPAAILLPAIVSAALLVRAYMTPVTGRPFGPHARRLILGWTLVEAGAIVLASSLLHQAHRDDAVFPVSAAIVGVHFVPLARGLPVGLYYFTAAGFVGAGAFAVLLPAADRPLVVGLGAAVTLWATAFAHLSAARRTAVSATSERALPPAA